MKKKLMGNKGQDKEIKNTTQANEQSRDNVKKGVKRVAAVIATVMWKPMAIIIITFSVIMLIGNFLKVIFNIKEEDIADIKNTAISLQYGQNLRNY